MATLWLVPLNGTRTTPFTMMLRNWLAGCVNGSVVQWSHSLSFCVERFAKFAIILTTLLLLSSHFALSCASTEWRKSLSLSVSGCLSYRLEESHFIYRNIPPGHASFSLVILVACGQFWYSITLLAYCLIIPSLGVFWRYIIVLTKTFPLLMDCCWLPQSIMVSLYFPSSRYFVASVSVFCAVLCVPVPCNKTPWLGWSTLWL